MDNKEVDVNVEQIMAEIREQIAREQAPMNLPAFESVPVEGTPVPQCVAQPFHDGDLQQLNANYCVPYQGPATNNKLKALYRKIVRRLTKCVILPILVAQNEIHANIVRCLNNIHGQLSENLAHHAAADNKIKQLEALQAQSGEHMRNMQNMLNAMNTPGGQPALHEAMANIQKNRESLQQSVINLHQLQDQCNKQQDELAQLRIAIDSLQNHQNVLNVRADQAVAANNEILNRFDRADAVQNARNTEIMQRLHSLDRDADMFSSAVSRAILRRSGNTPIKHAVHTEEATVAEVSKNNYEMLDYFKFQNTFRGSRREIKERLRMYLPYFENADAEILDIGCGRGEFLQLMKESGIPAFGIDLYPEYEIEGELNGIDIRQGDAIEFLKNSSEQFGGIFVGQVVEHISTEQLFGLCKAAYANLTPGSSLIMETPNPTSLAMYTSSFYIDPTHQRPIHPLLLQYIAKEAGFGKTELVFTQASRVEKELPLIQGTGIDNLDEVNAAIQRVSNMLYGSLDYAVIATK